MLTLHFYFSIKEGTAKLLHHSLENAWSLSDDALEPGHLLVIPFLQPELYGSFAQRRTVTETEAWLFPVDV